MFASAVGHRWMIATRGAVILATTEGEGRQVWVPRELRHTFVSLLSAHGVPVEAIALLAGHNQTATTELVYRHQIVPALHRVLRLWTRSSASAGAWGFVAVMV